VIGQHGDELLLVREQRVELRLGDLGERLVRRRKDGERARALERFDQAGFLQRGGERVELARRDGGFDDVLGLGGRGCKREGGDEKGFLHDELLVNGSDGGRNGARRNQGAGRITRSIAWMTPLRARRSVSTMRALRLRWSVTTRLPSTVKVSPCTVVIGDPIGTSARGTSPGTTW